MHFWLSVMQTQLLPAMVSLTFQHGLAECRKVITG